MASPRAILPKDGGGGAEIADDERELYFMISQFLSHGPCSRTAAVSNLAQ